LLAKILPQQLQSKKSKIYKVDDSSRFADECMLASGGFDYFARLENHDRSYPFAPFPKIMAVGAISNLILDDAKGAFEKLEEYRRSIDDYLFGYFSYDLKNDVEDLKSEKPDQKGFPQLAFFQPEYLIEIQNDVEIKITGPNPAAFMEKLKFKNGAKSDSSIIGSLECDIDRKTYIKTIDKLRNHIREGDFYEINYCMEYLGYSQSFSAPEICLKLWNHSPTPFASYFKLKDNYLLCASPERFLKKTGTKLISQPIKGTITAGNSDEEKKENRLKLLNSEKERAENMMIVDLVRNDLAKSSLSGTVKVEELFGIYEFRHLLQMISTVSSELRTDISPVQAIKNAFPMGSMTGAPKKKVMEMIDQYESSSRGIFSGSAGYFTPGGDFDFNVIIRSLFYNAVTKVLSYSVGGAITYDSDPEAEYEECMLKAKSIREIPKQGE
jgi:para-aminobenzoate synthetase component 1